MRQNANKTAALCSAFFDLIINIGSIYLSMLILGYENNFFNKTIMAVATICGVASVVIYFVCDMYSFKVFERLHKSIIKLTGVQFFILCVIVVIIAIFAPTRREYYILLFSSAALSYCVLVAKKIISTKILHNTRRIQKHKRTILLVGNGRGAIEYKKQLIDNPHYGYEIIGCVSDKQSSELEWHGAYKDLEDVLKRLNPDEVVIAVTIREEPKIQEFIDVCDKQGVRASIVPPIYRYFKSKCQVDMVGTMPVINTRDIPLDNIANAAMKRAMDIVISLIAIILTSPLMLIAVIGVRLSSPGPIIFKQERVGKNNKPFTMYKFRSMRVNSEEQTGWTTPEDKRKTRFGTFLRKTGIDELPQFFNVLFGSMSIIGPRPELPTFVEQYSKTVPLYKVKHQVKPGITGLAQIYGFRGDTSIEGRIEMDIKYIENWSLFNDIKILILTPFKMFNRNEKYVK
ncbi:MAG: undecaprenyl-phosphate glucose phosphotransferase [Clostridia bacterium]|nr:undecaprenyl-phosphate glucose phosphotransferase [Clostridia bacterium]